MSFKNEDPLASLERDLRANRPQLDPPSETRSWRAFRRHHAPVESGC